MGRQRNKAVRRINGARGRWVALIACVLVTLLAVPASASAARGLTTGFGDPDEFQSGDAATRALWFDRAAAAGAGIVRIAVEWPGIAGPVRPVDPTNPGSVSYDFSSVDGAVRDAEARGLKVLLTVNHAPTWAEGPNRPANAATGTWEPNPSDVADFAQAVAARYSGNFDPDSVGPEKPLPAAQDIEVWDEPNSSDWLTPQFQGKTPVAADRYRQMLNASYKAVKSVNPSMQVVTGGTDPYGDPPGGPYPSGTPFGRTSPVLFWERVLCVKPAKGKKGKKGGKQKFVPAKNCPDRAMFDVFAHHPIDNTGGGQLTHGPRKDDASTPDLGRVVSVLRAAEKAGNTLPGRHPVWVTEFWWDSKPPNPVGAPLLTQARWLEQSMYLFWKAGASAAINFQIADSSARPNEHAGLQSGVYFQDGRPKPSLTAFKFPFVTARKSTRTLEAWGKAPEAGTLRIQRQQGSRWLTVKKLQVSKGGVFDTTLKLRGKQQLRAVVGSSQSVVWKQAAAGKRASSGGGGPSTRAIILLVIAGIALALVGAATLRRRQVRRMRQLRRRRPRAVTG